MPNELMSYEHVMLDNMTEKRKSVLAKMTDLYQPFEHNIYRERLLKEQEAKGKSKEREESPRNL